MESVNDKLKANEINHKLFFTVSVLTLNISRSGSHSLNALDKVLIFFFY